MITFFNRLLCCLCFAWMGVSVSTAQTSCTTCPTTKGTPLAVTTTATGANLNLSSFNTTITVSPGGSVSQALAQAKTALASGSVRVKIQPGVYHEEKSVFFSGYQNTLLIEKDTSISGEVYIRGSKVIADTSWNTATASDGSTIYYANYNEYLGLNSSSALNNPDFYDPPNTPSSARPVALRKEVLVVNGELYQQIDLKKGSCEISDPTQVLRPGTYAIVDNTDFASCDTLVSLNQYKNTVIVYPRCNTDWENAEVEVSVNTDLSGPFNIWLRFEKCKNVAIRNIHVQHFASEDIGFGSTISFAGDDANLSENILLEDLDISYNNGVGLNISSSKNVTCRNISCNYNGFSGILTSKNFILTNQEIGVRNFVMENIETNFNNWRGVLTNYITWATGGIKCNFVDTVLVKNHIAIGNFAPGLWFDSYCTNVKIEACRGFLNTSVGLFLELSEGPFEVKNCLYAQSGAEALRIGDAENITVKNSVFYGSDTRNFSQPRAAIGFGISERNNGEIGPFYIENSVLVANFKAPKPGIYANIAEHSTFSGAYNCLLKDRFSESGSIYWGAREFDVFSTTAIGGGLTGLSGWLTSTCQSSSTNSKWDDPRFVDPMNGNFSLLPDSPIASSGITPYQFDSDAIETAKDFFLKATSQLPKNLSPVTGTDQFIYHPAFTLINATIGKEVRVLKANDYVNLSDFDDLTFVVNSDPIDVGSVNIRLEKEVNSSWNLVSQKTENVAPFALFGDTPPNYTGDGSIFDADSSSSLGKYRLIAHNYCNDFGLGGKISSDTLEFNVVTNGLSITNFVMVDGVTNTTLADMAQIDYVPDMSIKAIDTLGVGSVKLSLTGPITVPERIENLSPYTLFGKSGTTPIEKMIPPGRYTITATPYSGDGATGEIGTPKTITFEVHPFVEELTLVKAGMDFTTTNADIQDMASASTINLPISGTSSVSVRAKISADNSYNYALTNSRRVRFVLSGTTIIPSEGIAPYALFGDTLNKYDSWVDPDGSHVLTARILNSDFSELAPPYTRRTVDFTITESSSRIQVNTFEEPYSLGLAYPNPTNRDVNFKLSNVSTNKATFILRNLEGRIIDQQEVFIKEGTEVIQVLLPSNLSERIYFYEINTDQGQTRGRLVIQK